MPGAHSYAEESVQHAVTSSPCALASTNVVALTALAFILAFTISIGSTAALVTFRLACRALQVIRDPDKDCSFLVLRLSRDHGRRARDS